jgi:protein ImuB
LAAVLHKEQVCACTPAAQALGIQSGMRRSTALGLAPQIALGHDNSKARQRYLQRIALGLLQYTPNLAFFNGDSLLLEVSASLRLFKGPRGVWQRIAATLNDLAPHVRLGMAPTAQGAWILACQTQSRQRRALQEKTLARKLDPLSIHVLPAAQVYAGWLQSIGCQTLEQLRKLPRSGLQHRSSPLLVQALDAAYGQSGQYFTWFEAPDLFSQRIDLIERLEHTNAVLAVAKRLIDQLCGWLHARQVAANTLQFKLHHEKGRHARPPTPLALALSQASWLPKDFSGLLGEQLSRLKLEAPVIAIELIIAGTQPRPESGGSLFPEPGQWLSQEYRLLDLLCARLGAGLVLQAQPQADYLPERANAWVPAGGQPDKTGGRTGAPGSALSCAAPRRLASHARPFWLLPEPLALATRNNHPLHNGAILHLIQGPERLESGWWMPSGHESRDYFIAQDPHKARYWIYRQRELPEPRWFLHGLFG